MVSLVIIREIQQMFKEFPSFIWRSQGRTINVNSNGERLWHLSGTFHARKKFDEKCCNRIDSVHADPRPHVAFSVEHAFSSECRARI